MPARSASHGGVILHFGGAHTLSVIAFDQIVALRDLGWPVAAACHPEGWEERLIEAEIPLWPVNLPHRASIPQQLVGARQFLSLLRTRPVALVHTHNAHHGVAGRIAARRSGLPSVHTWRYSPLDAGQDGLRRLVYGAAEALASRAGTEVLFQNHEDLAEATRLRIVPRRRARWVGNGIDIERHVSPPRTRKEIRGEWAIPQRAPVVLCLARLVERKRQQDVVAALARMGRTDVHLILAGSGPDREALEAQASSLGLGDRVHFTGEVTDVTSLLHACDVLCLASRREGVPRVVMEAMSARLPVVATDVVGTREIVRHEQTGLLVSFASPSQIAAALGRILADDALRADLVARAHEEIRERWDQRLAVARISAAYAELLGGGPDDLTSASARTDA